MKELRESLILWSLHKLRGDLLRIDGVVDEVFNISIDLFLRTFGH